MIKDKRAVVIVPPLQDFYTTPHRISSLGIEIVKKILGNHGYPVSVLDCLEQVSPGSHLPLPSAFDYLKPYLLPDETGRCSFFTRFRHFGESFDEALTRLEPMRPTLIFLSCFAFCYSTPSLELAGRIKKRFPRTTIIAGGAGVSVFPEYFLRHRSIDYTLSGEAEVSLPPLLEYLSGMLDRPEAVPGFGWKEEGVVRFSTGKVSTTGDMLMPVIKKTPGRKDTFRYTASVSRGCAASCRFCSNRLTHGTTFRHCRAELFEEMLAALPGPPAEAKVQINFEDDNLLCDMPFFLDLIDRCRKRFPNSSFFAENGLDYRLLTPQRCAQLITAGFRQFNITVGSVVPEVLASENRRFDAERYHRVLALAADAGIPVISYLICGLPGDTTPTIAEGLRFLRERHSLIGMSMFYPVPGLPGFEDRSLFLHHPPQRCAGSSAYPWCDSVSTATLLTAFRLARFINLTMSNRINDEERLLIERTLQRKKIHTIVRENRRKRVIEVPRQDADLVEMVLEDG
ncbi:MAG: radical SAM protein [Chitinispirillaceae bacterium]|nr:radical SAM protein [Chitinispirillaceae bacterium]